MYILKNKQIGKQNKTTTAKKKEEEEQKKEMVLRRIPNPPLRLYATSPYHYTTKDDFFQGKVFIQRLFYGTSAGKRSLKLIEPYLTTIQRRISGK